MLVNLDFFLLFFFIIFFLLFFFNAFNSSNDVNSSSDSNDVNSSNDVNDSNKKWFLIFVTLFIVGVFSYIVYIYFSDPNNNHMAKLVVDIINEVYKYSFKQLFEFLYFPVFIRKLFFAYRIIYLYSSRPFHVFVLDLGNELESAGIFSNSLEFQKYFSLMLAYVSSITNGSYGIKDVKNKYLVELVEFIYELFKKR